MREASLICSREATRALDSAFADPPRGPGDVCVLTYVVDSKEPDGTVTAGFRPGYIPMVWAPGYASSDCAFGHLSDGSTFIILVSRHSPVHTAASVMIDILDPAQGTFSATPL